MVEYILIEMELNFEDILAGKDVKQGEPKQQQDVKLKQTDTRARQQSCMIHEVDKDLVFSILSSCLPIPNLLSRISESV